jgi:hypothetical protein
LDENLSILRAFCNMQLAGINSLPPECRALVEPEVQELTESLTHLALRLADLMIGRQ